MWVSPCLSDGLGNRLFQLAAAMGASEKYNRQLVFYLPRCYKSSHSSSDLLWKLFPTVQIIEVGSDSWEELSEQQFAIFSPFPNIIDPEKNLVVCGFRQSPQYFPREKEISPDFQNSLGSEEYNRLTEWFKSLSISSERVAFLHIRLGDYRILPHHQINLEQYWIQCLQAISNITDKLLIFSDEPLYVQNCMLPFFSQFVETSVVYEENPVACLYLMSLCGAAAISANSTFSWWGAYFSEVRKRRAPIFMPAKWGQGFEIKDLYPEWAQRIEI